MHRFKNEKGRVDWFLKSTIPY